VQVYAGAALYVAAAQRELEGFDDSFQTLSLGVEHAPGDAALLVGLANECLYAEQLEMAIKLARRAVRLRPSLRPAWIVLARCYVRMGLYSLALITLNVTPPPPLPGPEQVWSNT
jgi:predicted Zn-dependent protease